MNIFLKNLWLHNRAPFNELKLSLSAGDIAVLVAVNGKGKTTILSHIADAFHELAKQGFENEYEGRAHKFYRISSGLESLDQAKPSICYLRFELSDGTNIDYINARGPLDSAAYDALELPQNKIPFDQIAPSLSQGGFAKKVSPAFNREIAQKIFSENILTFFPSYRYEVPAYLNDPYQVQMTFAKTSEFSGFLKNPIEVVSGLPQLVNWLMDVVLDSEVNKSQDATVTSHIRLLNIFNSVISKCLSAKFKGQSMRIGIGPRNYGGLRIQILDALSQVQLYPSIFGLSSGEAALLCIFGELVRQADRLAPGQSLDEIWGIVLIDEVDKHLHLKLQKEVLPDLFNLFPNVQFIVSSHSPFLSIGLAEKALVRSSVVDLENFGLTKDPTTNELYDEVYRMMVGEGDKFREAYEAIGEKLKISSLPLVITEGYTDIKHLQAAKDKLGLVGLDFDFFEIPKKGWGSSELEAQLKALSLITHSRKILGIFDRDEPKIVADIESDPQGFKSYGNNVYGLCIPKPSHRKQYENISIEFYYSDNELRKEYEGKRLYFNNEIDSGPPGQRPAMIKPRSSPWLESEYEKKIFDQNIGAETWIHSKTRFADLVCDHPEFASEFNFEEFQLIFENIRKIFSLPS